MKLRTLVMAAAFAATVTASTVAIAGSTTVNGASFVTGSNVETMTAAVQSRIVEGFSGIEVTEKQQAALDSIISDLRRVLNDMNSTFAGMEGAEISVNLSLSAEQLAPFTKVQRAAIKAAILKM
jgi:hypothetical protein